MTRAFVFPGQGSQSIGMGHALAQAYPAARAVFDEVDEALGEKLSALIWEGDIADLTLTKNAQPALMAASIAALRALEAEGAGIDKAAYVAGHSLGEYSALCAAGVLSLSDTARLLRLRGQAMQEATPLGEGAMAAILGLDFPAVSDLAREASAAASAAKGGAHRVCEAANDNDPAQVVISGHADAVEAAMAMARDKGARRALPLPVSAPFHCALMAPAAERMAEALAQTAFAVPRCPVVVNVRAEAVEDPARFRELLVAQVTGAVRWRESVQWMERACVDSYWEIGAGKALSGMIRRISPAAKLRVVGTPDEVQEAAREA